MTSTDVLTNTTGGIGGSSLFGSGTGGGGGAGVVIPAGSAMLTVNNSTVISGGSGGLGANGGGGGAGLYMNSARSATIYNTGTITGGNGGRKSADAVNVGNGGNGEGGARGGNRSGAIAQGGAGIVGGDLQITNAGKISGGISGDGTTQAAAVAFTSGINTLTLLADSKLVGSIDVGTGALLTTISTTQDGQTLDGLRLGANAGVSNSDGNLTISSISGTGILTKTSTGELTLNGANSHTGGTILSSGQITVGSNSALGTGALSTNPGAKLDSNKAVTLANTMTLNGALTIGGTNALTLNGVLGGTASLVKNGTAELTLNGDNTYAGDATVNAGNLLLNGLNSRVQVTVNRSGTLSGTGMASSATVSSGGKLQGIGHQTLSLGSLVLNSGSNTNVTLGTTSSNALFNINTNLTLNGNLNVIDQGGFGAGIYRLFDYGGTLTNFGMVIGTTPAGVTARDLTIQTSVVGQVNLASTAGTTLRFWDGDNSALHGNGKVDGGSGDWRSGDNNWTDIDGHFVGSYKPNPGFVVFQGAAGTVTVDTSADALGVTGMQISTDGYRIEGDSLSLEGAGGQSIIRVGDGTQSSAGMTATIASDLTGASKLVKSDYGTLVLAGSNSYTGGTQVDGGVLSVSTASNLGASSGALTLNGGTLATTASFDTAHAVTLAKASGIDVAGNTQLGLTGPVTGNVELTKLGAGTLVLSGANSYGSTRVEAGTLIGSVGSISGDLLNNAKVVFDQAPDATYAGKISGNGSLTKRGAGALTLASSNAQDWHIETGTLISSADRYTGNTQVDAAGTLRFDQAIDATYANVLAGSGNFAKTAAGQLSLTGDSSGFTGHTQAQAGTLDVSGKLGGTLTVASGATLQGTGTVGTTTLQSGATIAPSNASNRSFNTLNVAGDLSFAPGSIYRVQADPTSATSDRIAVTGTASLAGSVVHIGPDGGFSSTRQYTILSANSVQGQFGSVSSNYAFLNPTLSYGAQSVSLQLERKQTQGTPVAFADAAQTGNQRAVARALDSLPAGSALHEYILTLPTGAPAAAFNSLSGDAHASAASAMTSLATTTSALPMAHLRGSLTAGMSPGAPTAQAGGTLPASALPSSNAQPAWAELVGNWQTLDGNGSSNSTRVKQNTGGLFVGADHAVGNGWRLGGALGYTDSNIRVDDRASKADVSSYSAALYGGKSFDVGAGKLNVLAGTSYTWHNIDSERYASVSGTSQKLTADYGANTTQLFSELGYAMSLSERVSVEPFAGLSWSDMRTRGFSESGGSAALNGQSSSNKQTNSTLGLRAQTGFTLGQTEAVLRATLGWRHAFGEVTPQSTMAFDGGQAFTVAGTAIARDAALAELGVDIAISRNATLGLNYSGQYGEGSREHAGSVNLRWRY